MAISRQGTVVGPISGALGGVVFYQGARSGVIGTRPHTVQTSTPQQRQRQRALLSVQTSWRAASEEGRNIWRSFAASLPWSNRLGVRRPLSGYNACLSYMLQIYPTMEGDPQIDPPPRGTSYKTPTIVSLSFTAGGRCRITTSNIDGIFAFEYLTLRLLRQYGPRTSPGQTIYVGRKTRYGIYLDWETEIASAGIALQAGDVVQARIYWHGGFQWPSQRATAQTTVL